MSIGSLVLGQTINGSAGSIDQYSFTAMAGKTYVLELTGTAPVMAGIWPGDPANKGGELRVCGTNARGRNSKLSGSQIVQVSAPTPIGSQNFQPTTGTYSLKVRLWTFFDNWWALTGQYKNSC